MTLKERIKSLLTAANATTGKVDTDLTAGVQSLIEKAITGNAIISDTIFTHNEDWTSVKTGNGETVAIKYANASNTADTNTYIIITRNNTAQNSYRLNMGLFKRVNTSASLDFSTCAIGEAYRGYPATTTPCKWNKDYSMHITKGTKVRVLKLNI